MTTETLMTEAQNTNEASPSSVPEGGPELNSQANADASEATGRAEGETGNDASQDNAGDTKDGEAGDSVLGAPEKYELTVGENIAPEVQSAFEDVARDLNLSQDAAQKVLDKMGPVLAQNQMDRIEKMQNDWAEQSRADKEFGGERLNENLSFAKKALDAFASPQLRDILNETGLGNHPEMIRMMFKAGKAISEDGHVGPTQSENTSPNGKDFNSMANALYPKN